MFADTGSFVVLLVYSLAVGAMLGVLYDAIMLALDTLFPLSSAPVTHETTLGATEKEAERTLFALDKKIRARDVALFFGDMLFFAISAIAVIILLYHLSYGEVRALSLASALAGFTVYKKTVGKLILRLAKGILKILSTVIKKTLSTLTKPLVSMLKRSILPKIEAIRLKRIRRRARKYLLGMERAEIKRRKEQNERSKSVGSDG